MMGQSVIGMLLRGGGALLSFVECYFDESGTHEGSPVMCVAGYIMEKRQAIRMCSEWKTELDKYELPSFHMVDCAHGNGEFANLTRDERISLQTQMIEIIKSRTTKGLAVSLSERDYKEVLSEKTIVGSAYSFCVNAILAGVMAWLDSNQHVERTAFTFESGHASQAEANRIMMTMFLNNPIKEKYRYSVHAFAHKECFAPLQAADILAWQSYTDQRHKLENRPRRKDYESLLAHPHTVMHLDKVYLQRISNAFSNLPDFGKYTKPS